MKGVVSTNALELGIDVGSLDAVIISGYPGTMMSTRQQAGGQEGKEGNPSRFSLHRQIPSTSTSCTTPASSSNAPTSMRSSIPQIPISFRDISSALLPNCPCRKRQTVSFLANPSHGSCRTLHPMTF